jgi:hypothetical protein
MMEAIRSPETPVLTTATRRHIPENGILQCIVVFLVPSPHPATKLPPIESWPVAVPRPGGRSTWRGTSTPAAPPNVGPSV